MKHFLISFLTFLSIYESKSQIYSVSFKKNIDLGKSAVMALEYIWKSPLDLNSYNEKEINLEIDVLSNVALDLNRIEILVNGKAGGNKAREVSMDWKSMDGSSMKKLAISNIITLSDGTNTVLLRLILKDGTIAENSISCTKIATTTYNGVPTTVWSEPDLYKLNGATMRWSKPEMPITLMVTGNKDLDKSKLKLIVNGLERDFPVSGTIQKQGSNTRISTSVTFKDTININYISIKYTNGIESWQSDKLKVKYYLGVRPELHVLCMAPRTNLNYSVKDGRDIASLFANQGGEDGNRIFSKVTIDTLLGSAASKSEMAGKIEELKANESIKASDLVIVFISSHGFIEAGTNEVRIQGNDYRANRSRATSISYKNDLIDPLNELSCKKLVFIDACHSGAKANVADINFELDKLNKSKGLTAIASSTKEQESHEDEAWENGAFTKAIKEGLGEGRADINNNGIVTTHELYNYLLKRVPPMVKDIKGKTQEPYRNNDELGDIGIYIVK